VKSLERARGDGTLPAGLSIGVAIDVARMLVADGRDGDHRWGRQGAGVADSSTSWPRRAAKASP
jgi:hypothetical protein